MVNTPDNYNSNEINIYKDQQLSPHLKGVEETFHLKEEFRIFMRNNQDVPLAQQHIDAAFLLFLIEQQRFAIINLTERVARLEAYKIMMESKPNKAYDEFIKQRD